MFALNRLTAGVAAAMLALAGTSASANKTELDALDLESAPEKPAPTSVGTRFFVEAAAGQANQRFGQGTRDIGRLSLDFAHTQKITPELRAVLSNRLDHFHPREAGSQATVNSLREAYLGWQPVEDTVLELGRVNLRYGPAYGYNPTDFFRDGSLRAIVSANPFTLRETRLGTVMLRGQKLWSGGSLSLAYSPKLEDRPSQDTWSLDLGSTNNRDRAVLALGTQLSSSVNTQLLIYKQSGLSSTVGASVSALVSDAAVLHAEWTRGKEPSIRDVLLMQTGQNKTADRFAGGLTYTTSSKLSLTAEYQYNGFGLSKNQWNGLGSINPQLQGAYIREALRRQEITSRQAYLFYATQRDLVWKDMDLTAFVRLNAEDRSRLFWLELRYRWSRFDLAFQWQENRGKSGTEYGAFPDRRAVQLTGTYRF
jgi:opacity protein-like surface antigen